MKDFEQRVLERMPSSDEERAVLGRVWNQVERAGGQIPDDVLRSVQKGLPSRHQRAWTFLPKAVAAVLVLGAAIGTAIVWPRGVRAYAAGADGLQVTLADDSRVEMRAHSEMTVGRASDGIQIDLKNGDIIVTAADQRDGHLYVRTKDMTIAVVGTIFLVNAEDDGSRVGVIEGEVRVNEGATETTLRPGQQVSTNRTLNARPLADEIAWSRHADVHRAVLESFRRGIAQTSSPLSPVVPADDRQRGTGPASPSIVEFEEASIRKCDPDNLPAPVGGGRGGSGPNAVYMTPGRFYALCMTPATLIRTAYGYRSWGQEVEMWFLNPPGGRTFSLVGTGSIYNTGVEDGRRVRGGPGWMRTEAYTIEAVAGDMSADQDACAGRGIQLPNQRPPGLPCLSANATSMSGPMLLALLERRFGLKAHIETEQTPAYSLVVAPDGLKMKEGACTTDTPRQRGMDEATFARWLMDLVRRNLDAARRGSATTGLCGLGIADNGPNRIFVGAGAGLPPLQGTLEAPVTDRTGIPDTRRFNYALEFLVEQTRNPFAAIAADPLQIAADPSRVQPAPNLFTALEQQLGLRLERTQVPREYIVIDAIKRPSPN